MNQVSKQLFDYLRDAIYNPATASLSIDELPEEFRDFGEGLRYYVNCVSEAQDLALSLSRGDLTAKLPSRSNAIAAPLKSLHSSLKHLTWQAQQIEQGDYSQRVEFMGEFSNSFNAMSKQLALRKRNDSNERARLQQYVDLLLLTTPNIILVLDTEGKAVLASESCLQQCNMLSAGELQGKTFDELFAPISSQEFLGSMNSMINDVLSNLNTIEVEQSIDFGRKGNEREYTVNINPMLYNNRKVMGVLLSFHDMTEIKQAQYEAERARELAEQSTRAKSSFLASMSHEIRTPMNAILGVTEIILQDDKISKDVEDGLDKIYNSCILLLGIINDILDFSKIEAGKLDIVPSQYKLASLINDSTQLNMMRIGSKPVKFELHIDENLPAKLVGDELRIKQILNNLLSNSFKYTSAGTVTLSVTSEPDCGADDTNISLVLSVRDTGRGMTKEQLSRLFEEYTRLNLENEKYIEGTGLGLTITQCLIDLMGGEISVESKPGIGSLFSVRLPQGKVDDEVVGNEVASGLRQFRTNQLMRQERRNIVRDPMPYGSVLIVDDVETNLYVASGLMKPYGLQVETAVCGRDAISRIKNGKVYDVVFMDHMMPEIDGIETVHRLRDAGYTAPVVALTANAVTGQMDMFLNNGFDDFISKPIDIRRLDVILKKFVRDKQPQEVLSAACSKKSGSCTSEAVIIQENVKLLESFIRDGRKALSVIDELRGKAEYFPEELRSFIITVHGMKSSLLYIGEASLSEAAKKLEMAGREKNNDYIRVFAPEFSKSLRALLERIEPKHEDIDEDEDVEALRDKLLILRGLCADYNRKGALDFLSGVKHCTKETRSVLKSINDFIVSCDFEEAEAVADEYISRLYMTA